MLWEAGTTAWLRNLLTGTNRSKIIWSTREKNEEEIFRIPEAKSLQEEKVDLKPARSWRENNGDTWKKDYELVKALHNILHLAT